jgi:hypothetical protein
VASNEHRQAIKIQNNLYSLIDKELYDIKLIGFEKKWKTSPVRVKSPISSPCPKKAHSGQKIDFDNIFTHAKGNTANNTVTAHMMSKSTSNIVLPTIYSTNN